MATEKQVDWERTAVGMVKAAADGDYKAAMELWNGTPEEERPEVLGRALRLPAIVGHREAELVAEAFRRGDVEVGKVVYFDVVEILDEYAKQLATWPTDPPNGQGG